MTKANINIPIKKELRQQIKIICAKKGTTTSELIRNYLENYVEKNKELL